MSTEKIKKESLSYEEMINLELGLQIIGNRTFTNDIKALKIARFGKKIELELEIWRENIKKIAQDLEIPMVETKKGYKDYDTKHQNFEKLNEKIKELKKAVCEFDDIPKMKISDIEPIIKNKVKVSNDTYEVEKETLTINTLKLIYPILED